MKFLFRGIWGCITAICIMIAIANHMGADTGVKTSDILPAWIGFTALCFVLPVAIFILLLMCAIGMIGVGLSR